MAQDMRPHYRPQVNGKKLQSTWYIPRMDCTPEVVPQPQMYPAPMPSSGHLTCPPNTVFFHPSFIGPPQPQPPVMYLGNPYCPPPQAVPAFAHPSQTAGGGYNYILPAGPAQAVAASMPISHMHTQPGYFSGPYHGPARSELKQQQKNAVKKETPQDMAPSDQNPDRFYQVQELDGSWTRRNRRTIDGHLGPIRWYQRPDGTWFAIRLSDG